MSKQLYIILIALCLGNEEALLAGPCNSKTHKISTVDEFLQAAGSGNEARVRQLLAGHTIDVNRANSHGHTALMRAAYASRTDVVRLLLQNGAFVNQATSLKKTGLTAVGMAAMDVTESNKKEREIILDLLLKQPSQSFSDRPAKSPQEVLISFQTLYCDTLWAPYGESLLFLRQRIDRGEIKSGPDSVI